MRQVEGKKKQMLKSWKLKLRCWLHVTPGRGKPMITKDDDDDNTNNNDNNNNNNNNNNNFYLKKIINDK